MRMRCAVVDVAMQGLLFWWLFQGGFKVSLGTFGSIEAVMVLTWRYHKLICYIPYIPYIPYTIHATYHLLYNL